MDSCFLTALLPSTLDSIEILFHVDNECYLSDVSPAYIHYTQWWRWRRWRYVIVIVFLPSFSFPLSLLVISKQNNWIIAIIDAAQAATPTTTTQQPGQI